MGKVIELYSDGAALGNPGPGGYGTILKYGKHEKEFSEGFRKTTNNRMELLAVIIGLEAIKTKGIPIEVYSDSKYVVDAVNQKWLFGWVKTGFNKKKNKDLWLRFLKIFKQYDVKMHWVKGHNGHHYNERCDQLSVIAAEQKAFLIDVEYENSILENDLFD